MKKYIIQDRETGTLIDVFSTRHEAEQALAFYEKQDKEDGNYTKDFYEIKEKTFFENRVETYKQIKERHQREMDAFPLGFAFSEKQFNEMMHKFGLPNDKNGCSQIFSIGAGGYVRKSDLSAFCSLCNRQAQELRDFCNEQEKAVEALRFEFANHEYQFNPNDEAVCRSVGLDTIKR